MMSMWMFQFLWGPFGCTKTSYILGIGPRIITFHSAMPMGLLTVSVQLSCLSLRNSSGQVLFNHLASQTQLTPVSVPHMWRWNDPCWVILKVICTIYRVSWVWLYIYSETNAIMKNLLWRLIADASSIHTHRGERTFTSTCNKYKHPDDVTLGAIIGTFANTYTSHGLQYWPLFPDPTQLLITCSTLHTASGKNLCGCLRTMLQHGTYSFDLLFLISETTLGYNLTDVPKMLNQLNVKEPTRKQSRIALKNLVLHL